MSDELPKFPQAPQAPPPRGIPLADRSYQKPLVKLMSRMLKPPPKQIRSQPIRSKHKKVKYW